MQHTTDRNYRNFRNIHVHFVLLVQSKKQTQGVFSYNKKRYNLPEAKFNSSVFSLLDFNTVRFSYS